ncbi:VOC family protein [Streptomyces sp. NPDC047022]|uniref:VOC family protein n=1 Tax=Streptomyces sp. NPDC047022 TaxID=3155737 RepID=UPI0033F7BC6B
MPTIPLFKVLVDDLDVALSFYTDQLGMSCLEDNRLGDYRWILVGFPGQGGLAVNLELARSPEEKEVIGRQAAGLPLFSISTDDCRRDHERMRAAGVMFDGEPEEQPWGIGVMLRDLVGNRIYLNQDL